jgi:hypothetical protein
LTGIGAGQNKTGPLIRRLQINSDDEQPVTVGFRSMIPEINDRSCGIPAIAWMAVIGY